MEAEQQATRHIRELLWAGLSLRHIGGVLAAEGDPTKRGGRWHPQMLARVPGGLDETSPRIARRRVRGSGGRGQPSGR